MRASLFLLAGLLAVAASADEVHLKSGGQLSGRIVSRTAAAIEIDVGAGRITVPTSTVVRVEEGRSALHEYEDRAAKLAPGDVNGWLALGDWASARALGTQARQAYERALAAGPDSARANEALGRVQVNGRWVSEDEGYQAKGYVKFEGEWITPAEHSAILQERAADGERERARQAADARVAEAEARAREAEQRAKEAEANAQPEGIPLWYGWGAGPVLWPTQPVVPPLSRSISRPVTR
jgi:hypothetical protein